MAKETPYVKKTVNELSAELERRGLPKTGKKADLIERLEDDDAAQGAIASEGEPAAVLEAAARAEAATDARAEDGGPATAKADDADVQGEAAEAGAEDLAQATVDDAEPVSDGDAESDDSAPTTDDDGPTERSTPRRGAAETSTQLAGDEGVSEPPRDDKGKIAVRAKARYVRTAPRKARLVMDHIRGKEIADARAILRHTPRSAATGISKLLESAVANAENNFELDPDDLRIALAFVDEGPTIKRFRPRALGRATPIHKRTSHMTITLTTTATADRAEAAGGKR